MDPKTITEDVIFALQALGSLVPVAVLVAIFRGHGEAVREHDLHQRLADALAREVSRREAP